MRLVGLLPEFVSRFIERFRAERCVQTAASLAFTTLLALVPLLAIALVLISKFELFAGLGEALRGFLLANLLPDKAGKIIATYALQFSHKAGQLTAIGTAMIVVTATMLMLSVDHAFGRIWRVKQPRPLLRRVAIYLGVLVLGPIVLGASIATATYLFTASLGLVDEPRWVTNFFLKMLPVALLAALFALLYFVVPNRRVEPWHAVAGGVVAAAGFSLIQRMFGIYIAQFPTYTLIYGAFATVPIFLVWLYLSWLVVLVGALTAAVLGDLPPGRR
jgi:membrane protein